VQVAGDREAVLDGIATTVAADAIRSAETNVALAANGLRTLLGRIRDRQGNLAYYPVGENGSVPEPLWEPLYAFSQAAMSVTDQGGAYRAALDDALANSEGPGPEGALIAAAMFGDSRFETQPVMTLGHEFVGDRIVLLDVVRRLVPTGANTMTFRTVPYAAVMAAILDPATATWHGADWDAFFGGTPNPGFTADGVPGTGNPAADLILWAVPVEDLAAPGGLGSDLVITAQLVTNVTSWLDPTPFSDGVQLVIHAGQGEFGEAAMDLGGMFVPFGFDKAARFAKNIPTPRLGQLQAAANARLNGARNVIAAAAGPGPLNVPAGGVPNPAAIGFKPLTAGVLAGAMGRNPPSAAIPLRSPDDWHHSDPLFMGGNPRQRLTSMTREQHTQLHRDLNGHLVGIQDANGNHMRPQRGNSGLRIQAHFTAEQRQQAMADFYHKFRDRYPDAADDFFSQHPHLD
jgi:hypothetical protein